MDRIQQILQSINPGITTSINDTRIKDILVTKNMSLTKFIETELTEFFHKKSVNRLVIYGAGLVTDKLLTSISLPQIVGITDSNKDIWGTPFLDFVVVSPGQLEKLEHDAVFIGSLLSVEEIKEHLIKNCIIKEGIKLIYPNDIGRLFVEALMVFLYSDEVLLR